MDRRDFIRKSALVSAGLTLGSNISARPTHKSDNSKADIVAAIPLPIQVVIDDVGWWSGEDGSEWQEPYRTGINRNHVPNDYRAIVRLGRELGIRPQAAMILCEWDKENILRKVPTSTWMGSDWDNSKWVGPWLEEAAEIIRNNRDHFELTLHGIGHEYWKGKKFTRAEWADKSGTMRPVDKVKKHLDFFGALLQQNNLGPYPTSFVPTAFLHGFGPTGNHDQSMAEVLASYGVEYVNTPFSGMYNAGATQYNRFGFDAGVITIDRGSDILSWDTIGKGPEGKIKGATCGMHWPNILHQDPEKNLEITDQWIKFLRPYNDKPDTMLAKDSLEFRHQLLHHTCTKAKLAGNTVELDFSEGDALPGEKGYGNLTLKIATPGRMTFKSNTIRIIDTSAKKYENSCLYKLQLERIPGRKKARIEMGSA